MKAKKFVTLVRGILTSTLDRRNTFGNVPAMTKKQLAAALEKAVRTHVEAAVIQMEEGEKIEIPKELLPETRNAVLAKIPQGFKFGDLEIDHTGSGAFILTLKRGETQVGVIIHPIDPEDSPEPPMTVEHARKFGRCRVTSLEEGARWLVARHRSLYPNIKVD